MKDFRINAGKKIRYYRELAGLSQEELGNEIGVVRDHMSRLENGHSTMGTDILMKLCDFFGVTPNDILLEPIPEEGSGEKRTFTEAEKLLMAKMRARELYYILSDGAGE